VSLARLVELAREEQKAVAERRWETLVEIRAEQHLLLRGLAGRLSSDALPALELVLDRCAATEKLLSERLAETQRIIERLRTGRRAVRGYAGGAGRAAGLEIRV